MNQPAQTQVLNHAFTTPILRDSAGLTAARLAEARDYLLEIQTRDPGEMRSNRGGWHSTGNLFGPEHPALQPVRDAATRAIFKYVSEAFNHDGEVELAITGWTVINRAGDFNSPHNHAANFLSGAIYIALPPGMRGGEIVFQDPRSGLNASETEGMRRLKLRPPWLRQNISVAPTAGDVLVFPSWLLHYVEPFQCDDPAAVRIVVSFNATV